MLGLTRHTVRQLARAATACEMIVGPRPRSSGQDHFAADLQQRWNQGCTDAALLHAEIAAQGYQGSKRPVRRYRQPLRATLTAPALPPPTVRGSHPVDHQPPRPPHRGRDSQAGKDQGPQPAAERHRRPRHRLRRDDDRPPPRAPARVDHRSRTRRPALPCMPSPGASVATRPPSPTGSPSSTAAAPPRAPSATSKPASARCPAAPTSTSCERESCSAHRHHIQSPVHDLCARASS